MTFRFTGGQSNAFNNGASKRYTIDMCLESTFDSGKIIQSIFTYMNRSRLLVYREGVSGRWLNSCGINMNGLERTPENLAIVLGGGNPVRQIYVIPAV